MGRCMACDRIDHLALFRFAIERRATYQVTQLSSEAGVISFAGGTLIARLLLRYARRFPTHRGKTRAFEALARMFFGNDLPVVSGNGAQLSIDPFDYIGHAICFDGSFEPRSLALASQIMQGGGVFLDVGANFGLYSCYVGTIPGVECVAVDANPVAFVRLQENVRRNGRSQITTVNTAIGSHRGLVALMAADSGNLGTGRVADGSGSSASGCCRVGCLPLGELLAELGVGPIKLMKIDVEGYELQVFRGLDFQSKHAPAHIIAEHKPQLVADSQDVEGTFELLSSSGYKPFTIGGEVYQPGVELPEDNLWWRRDV